MYATDWCAAILRTAVMCLSSYSEVDVIDCIHGCSIVVASKKNQKREIENATLQAIGLFENNTSQHIVRAS